MSAEYSATTAILPGSITAIGFYASLIVIIEFSKGVVNNKIYLLRHRAEVRRMAKGVFIEEALYIGNPLDT